MPFQPAGGIHHFNRLPCEYQPYELQKIVPLEYFNGGNYPALEQCLLQLDMVLFMNTIKGIKDESNHS